MWCDGKGINDGGRELLDISGCGRSRLLLVFLVRSLALPLCPLVVVYVGNGWGSCGVRWIQLFIHPTSFRWCSVNQSRDIQGGGNDEVVAVDTLLYTVHAITNHGRTCEVGREWEVGVVPSGWWKQDARTQPAQKVFCERQTICLCSADKRQGYGRVWTMECHSRFRFVTLGLRPS